MQPTIEEQLQATVMRADALESQNGELKKALDTSKDTAKHQAARLKEKNHAVTEARKDERAKLHDERMSYRKEEQARADERAAKRKEDELATINRQRNAANARARAAENEKRKLERTVSKLEKKLEESSDEEMADADDESPDESEDEDPTARLPFELLPRRDESGRWQAESPEIHGVRMAQSARGVAPSTISANIQDVLSIIAPGIDIPAACERQSRILRGETTLAGEAMAAWKFAKCKRVVWFGWDE